jgi:hypothetical protein
MTVLSTLRYTTFRYVRNQCWYNAAHNIIVYKNLTGKDLHWVVGAMVIWADRKNNTKGSIGYDGATRRDNDLGNLLRNHDDSHAWLEDDEGNVYDYFYEENVPPIAHPDFTLEAGFIDGVPRKVLAQQGYDLRPFNESAQAAVPCLLLQKKPTDPEMVARLRNLRKAVGDVENVQVAFVSE